MDAKGNLDKFINRTLNKSLAIGLEKVLQSIENDAVKECPHDDGTLRADIKHVVDKSKLEGLVGNTVEYAPYVHQGTGIYAVEGNGRQTPWSYQSADGKWHTTEGQKPNPYLQRAIDNNKARALEILKSGVITEWKK